MPFAADDAGDTSMTITITAADAAATRPPRIRLTQTCCHTAPEPPRSSQEPQDSDQLGALSAPFLREAVGIGARWRVTSSLQVSGIEARQVLEYSVREREGSQVAVDIDMTQTARCQRAELPGLPKVTKLEINKWKVCGSGSATLSLVKPGLPLSSVMRASGSHSFDVSAQGQRGTLDQKITTDVEVSS